ncbi:MAG: hypothetical protein HZA12_03320 [Nitrospirae bacterium]|nr:hypothetical protein [Nitrospirota bacterium]
MKSGDITLARITRPRFADIYQRKRLFNLLDKARGHPVLWITGPPGYGKTILVSSYIESRKLSCLWYQADAGDGDIATFFYYMGLAARKASPRRRKGLPILTPEYLPGLSTFTRRYFENLYGRLKPPACLVLDNYQEVPPDSMFHEVIRHGFGVIPDGVRIIVVSRGEPPALLACLRASHSMEVLSKEALTLTPEETLGIMKLRLNWRQSEKPMRAVLKELAGEIHRKTHGWAAGVILMLEKIKKGTSLERTRDMKIETVYDYFTSEIMGKLNEETRVFLLKTALLPDMDAGMVERLTGAPHGRDILLILSSTNCFTERRPGIRPVFQYHPLFREYLLFRTQAYFEVDELRQLKLSAALILEGSGMTEDAFELCRDAGDYEGAKRLLLAHARELVTQARWGVLGQWIAFLPEEMVNGNPWLLYWLGVSRTTVNPQEAYTLFDRAFGIFRIQKNKTGIFLSLQEIVSIFIHASPSMRPLDRWLKILDEVINEYGGLPDDVIGARMASSIFMAIVYRQSDPSDIARWEDSAVSLSEKSQDIHILLQTRIGQTLKRLLRGESSDTRVLLDSLRRLQRSKDATPLVEMTILFIEAVHFAVTASHEECLSTVSEGQKLSAYTGVHVFDFQISGQGAISALNSGDLTMAKRFLGEMTSSVERMRPADQSFYHFLRAYYGLLRGDISQAASDADVAYRMALDAGFALNESLCHILNAHILHEQKRYREAKRRLDTGRKIADRIWARNVQFLCLLTEAHFVFDRGDEERGLKTLRKAMALGREQGYANNYLWLPDMMAGLCVRALDAGLETEYVRWLIKRRGITPKTPPLEVEEWPWAVRFYTLGRFALVRDGQPVRFSRKAQQRPLDLLKALISLGGRDVREEHLSDLLWPECDGDVAYQAVVTNLFRVRRLIGVEKVVILSDGKMSLDPRYCWVDAWAFERLIGKAESAIRSGDNDQGITFIEKAVALYQGPFLSDSRGEEWTTLRRERLRNKYLRFTGELGRLYEEKGDLRKVIETYQKGIEGDPAAEEFYQHLMTCYQRLGRRAEALSAYDRLKKVLAAMMDISPSPATEAILRSLK